MDKAEIVREEDFGPSPVELAAKAAFEFEALVGLYMKILILSFAIEPERIWNWEESDGQG